MPCGRWCWTLALIVACVRQDDSRAGSGMVSSRSLSDIPVMPGSHPTSFNSGQETVHTVLVNDASPDSALNWYRTRFAQEGRRIVSDQQTPDGTTLHTEENGPSLWVTIRPGAGGVGCEISVVATMPSLPVPPEPQ